MKKKTILSAVIGGAFFSVPYFLGMGTPFSVLIGAVAYGAGTLVLGDDDLKIDTERESISSIVEKAKDINSDIICMLNRVEDDTLKKDIREIYQISNKIITVVAKSPKKMKYVDTFFSYYLPETYKLLKQYDEIENQKLGQSGELFLSKTRSMISKIKGVFKQQLNHLYQKDLIDINAEMKVFDTMIKSDGYGESDFKL